VGYNLHCKILTWSHIQINAINVLTCKVCYVSQMQMIGTDPQTHVPSIILNITILSDLHVHVRVSRYTSSLHVIVLTCVVCYVSPSLILLLLVYALVLSANMQMIGTDPHNPTPSDCLNMTSLSEIHAYYIVFCDRFLALLSAVFMYVYVYV